MITIARRGMHGQPQEAQEQVVICQRQRQYGQPRALQPTAHHPARPAHGARCTRNSGTGASTTYVEVCHRRGVRCTETAVACSNADRRGCVNAGRTGVRFDVLCCCFLVLEVGPCISGLIVGAREGLCRSPRLKLSDCA